VLAFSNLEMQAKDQDPCFFSSLPLEILTHHILKFFDFRGCLTLAVVCKHWQHAVEKSHLPKQFSITESMDLEYASTVLSKYKIATLVIDLSISFTKLRDILDVSPFTTTLVLCPNNQYDTEDLQTWDYPTRTTSLEFKQITTISMEELCDSKYFPNVTKLKLHNLKVLYYSPNWKERRRYSNVKELEINVSSSLRFDFGLVKELFPNVDKVYVNYDCKRNKKRLEEYWRRMEEIGWSIGVQIICRNPHLSNRVDVFSLTSTSYIEFFNGFGMTPLRKFLRGHNGVCSAFERCQDQFWKYTSKQYEKDLCLREPQFNFPTRSPQFGVDVAETVFNLPKSEVSCEAVMSLLKCGFINPWEALEYDMFSDCPIEYYQTILEHCDVQALNNDGMNLATLSFNRCCFLFWWQLTEAGAAIQSDKYLNDFSRSFLKELSNPKSPLPTQVLARLDQKYLQSLVPYIEEFVFDPWGSVKRNKKLLEEFLRLGVKLDDKQRSLLVCRMAQSCLVEEFSQLLPELGLNEPNDKGNTPLMMSIRNCYGYKLYPQYLSQAKFLLLNGADPNTQTTSQKGEIKCAVFLKNAVRTFHKDFSFIALLHAHGADFAVEDERGNTVLNRAVSTCEDVDVASLSKLVSIDKPNHDNCTPLFYVINRRQLRWAAQLIEEGVDVNAVAGPLLQPPLITAIELNDESIAYELLASQRIDIKLRDKAGHSFVHYLLATAEAGFLGKNSFLVQYWIV
jgi:ankyrin repeat protein